MQQSKKPLGLSGAYYEQNFFSGLIFRLGGYQSVVLVLEDRIADHVGLLALFPKDDVVLLVAEDRVTDHLLCIAGPLTNEKSHMWNLPEIRPRIRCNPGRREPQLPGAVVRQVPQARPQYPHNKLRSIPLLPRQGRFT